MNTLKTVCYGYKYTAAELHQFPMRRATKTKPIKAKHISAVLVDNTIAGRFLLDTLEGKQPIRPNCMVCVGAAGDIWPQDSAKLLKKYEIVGMTEDGWMICNPKPDNEVLAEQFVTDDGNPFSIMAQWGTPWDGGFYQNANSGDYVLQSVSDPNDVWVVARKLFESTYEFCNE